MNPRMITALAGILLTVMLLAGCGNKGPLYLPEQNGDDAEATEASEDAEDRR